MATAKLGYEIDSSQASRASVDLDKMAASAQKAEQGAKSLSTSSRQADTATGQFAASATSASTATAQLDRTIDMVAVAHGRAAVATNVHTAAVQANAAANRMAQFQLRSLQFQLFDVAQTAALGMNPLLILMQQGPQIAQIYGPEEGGVARAFKEMGAMMLTPIRTFPLLSAAAIAAGVGIAGLTVEINRASDVTVGFGDVALATFQVIRDGVYDFLQPAIQAIAPWFVSAWDMAVAGTKVFANTFIQALLGAFEMVKFGVMSIPDAFIVAGEAAANGFLEAIRKMVQGTVTQINTLVKSIQQASIGTAFEGMARGLPTFENRGRLDDGSAGPFASENWRVDAGGSAARDRLAGGYGAMDARVSEIVGTDYMGGFFDAVKAQAVKNSLGEVEEAAKGAGLAAEKAANDNTKAWDQLARQAQRAAQETMRFWQDVGRGFVNDLRSGIEEGKGLWQSLADAALNALDKITSKLIDMATDSLISSVLGGFLGGGALSPKASGLLSTGRITGLWANGGAFDRGNVIPFANGDVVGGPTSFPMSRGRTGLMGEAGPEAIMPLRRGSDGKLGVVAANMNGAGGGTVKVEVEVYVNDDGTLGAIARQAGQQGGADAVTQYDKLRANRYANGAQFG